eukprot:28541_1
MMSKRFSSKKKKEYTSISPKQSCNVIFILASTILVVVFLSVFGLPMQFITNTNTLNEPPIVSHESYYSNYNDTLNKSHIDNDSNHGIFSWIPDDIIDKFDILNNDKLSSLLTPSSLRRSRPIIGDITRYWNILDRVKIEKTCLKIGIFGGSITQGHALKHGEKSWWQHFKILMDSMYQCNDDTSNGHLVETIIKIEGSTSMFDSFMSVYVLQKIIEYDIIIVEFANNDAFSAPAQKVSDSRNTAQQENVIGHSTEKLIRLLLNLPNHPMILYMEMGWRWGQPKMHAPYFDNNGYFGQYKLLFYYQIPTISIFHALYPPHLYKDIVQNNDKRKKKYLQKLFPDLCHPVSDVHKLGAMLLVYSFLSEEQSLRVKNEFHSVMSIPKSWMLTIEEQLSVKEKVLELQLWINNSIQVVGINFMNPPNNYSFINNQTELSLNVTYNFGWKHMNDHATKNKYGMVAFDLESLITFEIPLNTQTYMYMQPKHIKIVIGYLKTHENIGKAAVWVDAQNKFGRKSIYEHICCNNSIVSGQTGQHIYVLDGLWQYPSVDHYYDIFIDDRRLLNSSNYIYLHICPILSNDKSSSKFKLLDITVLYKQQ